MKNSIGQTFGLCLVDVNKPDLTSEATIAFYFLPIFGPFLSVAILYFALSIFPVNCRIYLRLSSLLELSKSIS